MAERPRVPRRRVRDGEAAQWWSPWLRPDGTTPLGSRESGGGNDRWPAKWPKATEPSARHPPSVERADAERRSFTSIIRPPAQRRKRPRGNGESRGPTGADATGAGSIVAGRTERGSQSSGGSAAGAKTSAGWRRRPPERAAHQAATRHTRGPGVFADAASGGPRRAESPPAMDSKGRDPPWRGVDGGPEWVTPGPEPDGGEGGTALCYS